MATNQVRNKRHKRVRAKVSGTAERPRVSVFRSNSALYVQVVDDILRHTLVADSTLKSAKKGTNVEKSEELGKRIAKELTNKGVKTAVFDRGGYRYHGRVKAVADGIRSEGVQL